MGRLHLLEIEDQPWCPKPIRDGGTDFLEFTQSLGKPYTNIVPRLADALRTVGATEVVDLCSGGAGPWLRLAEQLEQAGAPVKVRLSDLHPNTDAFARIEAQTGGRISGVREPVDATRTRAHGFRTVFNAFHHFRPEGAKAILEDAVRQGDGIAVFEAVERSPAQILAIPLMGLTQFVFAPFMRPFRFSRVLFTYVLPLIPLLILFDGIVSCLRIYSPEELRALVRQVEGADRYEWDIGRVRSVGPSHITYLIGVPRAGEGPSR